MQTRADELDLATRMLAARAQTMTSVIDAVTEQSIIGTDRDGIIRVWNPGAEKMLGLPRPEVVRKRSILEFHLPEELEAAAEDGGTATGSPRSCTPPRGTAATSATGPTWPPTGSRAPSRSRSRRAPTTRATHAGWNFVGTDMTEARATETHEGPVREPDQPRAAHARSPRSSATSSWCSRTRSSRSPTSSGAYLTTVERNADRLLRLVGDLLFTAQVDAGRFTLKPEDVDLATVVRAAEESVRVTAAAAGVEVVVDVPADGARGARRRRPAGSGLRQPRLQRRQVHAGRRPGDAVPARRVADPRRRRSPPTEARTRRRSRSWRSATPASASPSTEQGKLFTRFFRASTAQKNAVPGVGLGLAITKAITTAHGGTLDLVSAEGAGTTFTLTLPL